MTTAQKSSTVTGARQKWLSAPRVVLSLLCLLYLILFVNRVAISTAAPLMKRDLGLTNTQLGFAFSAFAIPYALFQLLDRRPAGTAPNAGIVLRGGGGFHGADRHLGRVHLAVRAEVGIGLR